MDTRLAQGYIRPLEKWTLIVGFILAGLAIAVTAVSYGQNMNFKYQWLVWVITGAFGVAALATVFWSGSLGKFGEAPEGGLRQYLLVSIPLAYVLGSQVCGLGLKDCSAWRHAINLSLIGLGTVTAYRLHRGQSVGASLFPW